METLEKLNNHYNCNEFHESCFQLSAERLITMIKYTLKMYSFVHCVPLIFKYKKVKDDFYQTLKETLIKIARSVAFMSLTVVLCRISTCLVSKIFGKYCLALTILQSLFASTSCVVESNDRIKDYVIFQLPYSLQAIWDLLVKLGITKNLPKGQELLFALSLSALLYLQDKDDINTNYKRMFSFFIYE